MKEFSLLIFVVYFLPTFIAIMNKSCVNRVGAFIVNLVFGFTIIGWVIALVMACNTGKSTN